MGAIFRRQIEKREVNRDVLQASLARCVTYRRAFGHASPDLNRVSPAWLLQR